MLSTHDTLLSRDRSTSLTAFVPEVAFVDVDSHGFAWAYMEILRIGCRTFKRVIMFHGCLGYIYSFFPLLCIV